MKLKSFSPILNGYETEAVGAALAQYHVIKATAEELAALEAAGYALPVEERYHD
jgi:hypothetical protein